MHITIMSSHIVGPPARLCVRTPVLAEKAILSVLGFDMALTDGFAKGLIAAREA